jgi:predicted transcriptional regulator
MSRFRTLKIGIAPYQTIKKRTLAIVRGEYKPSTDEPKVWFSSIESMARVLSTNNRLLLEIIAKSNPPSLTALAEMSKRKKSNLSRTLKTMERFGLVRLSKDGHGHVVPKVTFDRLRFDLDIAKSA